MTSTSAPGHGENACTNDIHKHVTDPAFESAGHLTYAFNSCSNASVTVPSSAGGQEMDVLPRLAS